MKSSDRVHLTKFERLIRRHQDRVYGYACTILRSREDARDVTQEVLVRLWRRREEVDDETALAWLMRVTRNACIDELRRRRRAHEVVSTGADVEDLPHNGASPSDRLERVDDREAIDSALASIAEPYRSIVILREIQHLKYEEISGAMDLPLNTVKVYLHRGRKMLRKQLTGVVEREGV